MEHAVGIRVWCACAVLTLWHFIQLMATHQNWAFVNQWKGKSKSFLCISWNYNVVLWESSDVFSGLSSLDKAGLFINLCKSIVLIGHLNCQLDLWLFVVIADEKWVNSCWVQGEYRLLKSFQNISCDLSRLCIMPLFYCKFLYLCCWRRNTQFFHIISLKFEGL